MLCRAAVLTSAPTANAVDHEYSALTRFGFKWVPGLRQLYRLYIVNLVSRSTVYAQGRARG